MSTADITDWIASHPELLHVLFVGLIVLSQGWMVIADNGMSGGNGP